MKTDQITKKFIEYSDGNLHDINHFMKVYAYAKTIGKCENLCEKDQFILEVASIIHDIACPLCRKKYGNTNGKYQEIEGEVLAKDFLADMKLDKDDVDRIVYLVSHHHTYNDVSGMDYQILLEADYIVNADESKFSKENINSAYVNIFKTATGKDILNSMYL